MYDTVENTVTALNELRGMKITGCIINITPCPRPQFDKIKSHSQGQLSAGQPLKKQVNSHQPPVVVLDDDDNDEQTVQGGSRNDSPSQHNPKCFTSPNRDGNERTQPPKALANSHQIPNVVRMGGHSSLRGSRSDSVSQRNPEGYRSPNRDDIKQTQPPKVHVGGAQGSQRGSSPSRHLPERYRSPSRDEPKHTRLPKPPVHTHPPPYLIQDEKHSAQRGRRKYSPSRRLPAQYRSPNREDSRRNDGERRQSPGRDKTAHRRSPRPRSSRRANRRDSHSPPASTLSDKSRDKSQSARDRSSSSKDNRFRSRSPPTKRDTAPQPRRPSSENKADMTAPPWATDKTKTKEDQRDYSGSTNGNKVEKEFDPNSAKDPKPAGR